MFKYRRTSLSQVSARLFAPLLSLFAGIVYVLVVILFALGETVFQERTGGGPGLLFLSIGLVSGVLMVVGAALMFSKDTSRLRSGSVLVLVFTLIGALFTAFGLMVGFVMGMIGSITGLVSKLRKKPARTAAAPPEDSQPFF